MAGKGILVTAKGYPDIQTRQFLKLLSKQQSVVPIFALMDFDPDGIGIMSTYRYGSVALAHENAHLAVPRMRWLGIRSCEITQDHDSSQAHLKMTHRDRRVATRMLEKQTSLEYGHEDEWQRELQVMLMMNSKAEIQILGNGAGLESWLDMKLSRMCKSEADTRDLFDLAS